MTDVSIFTEALKKNSADEQRAFLADACGGDDALRQRIEELITAHSKAGNFLATPAIEQIDGRETPIDATATFTGKPALPRDSSPIDATNVDGVSQREDGLDYLAPSQRPGSLGRIDHYEVLDILGKGGFGTVFKAFDEKLHRVVAIKVLAPELAASGTARARFLREAKSAAAVKHDNVVSIYAVVDESAVPFLVMEYVEGQTLQQKLDKTGPLELKEILRIGLQIAEGLAAAHKQGLMHRDIKPGNILLENGVERVKITDFGLARAVDDASVTQSGVVAGTPMYMSPEQAEGLALDQRSDLFSLGTVLYVMCTGRPPFRATGTMAVLRRVIEETPRAIREVNNDIPQWLCDIVTKLHAKKPEERYQSAREVAELLAKYLTEIQLHGQVLTKAIASEPAFALIGESKDTTAKTTPSVLWHWAKHAMILASGCVGLFYLQRTIGLEKQIAGPAWIVSCWLPGIFFVLYFLAWFSGSLEPTKSSSAGRRRLAYVAGGLLIVAAVTFLNDLLHTGDSDSYVKVEVTWNELLDKPIEVDLQELSNGANVHVLSGSKAKNPPVRVVRPREGKFPPNSISLRAEAAVSPAGMYHLRAWEDGINYHTEVVTIEPGKPNQFAIPDPPSLRQSPNEEGWVKLFNGKDLTGWTAAPQGNWQVDQDAGQLIGRGPMNYLYTQDDNFADFHLRAEISAGDGVYSGVVIRSGITLPHGKFPAGYVVNANHGPANEAGCLWVTKPYSDVATFLVKFPRIPVPADTFALLEVIAQGKRIIVKINKETVANYSDEAATYRKGRIGLQVYDEHSVIRFRKIEIKELPPSSPEVPRRTADVLPFLAGNWKVEAQDLDPKVPPNEAIDVGHLTQEYVANGRFLRGRMGRGIVMHSFDADKNVLRHWAAWSNGEAYGPVVGEFNPDSRALVWRHRLSNGIESIHQVEFVDGNTIKSRIFERDAKDNLIQDTRLTFTRVKGPIAHPALPIDPKRPDEMKVLDRLVGEWHNEVTYKHATLPNQPTVEAVRIKAESILEGRFIEAFATGEKRNDYVLSWFDVAAKQYRSWHFFDDGSVVEASAFWDESSKTLTWKPKDGSSEYKQVFKSDDLIENPLIALKDENGKIHTEISGFSRRIITRQITLPDTADQVLPALAGAWKGEYTQKIYGGKPAEKKIGAVAVNDWIVGQKWLRQRVQMENEGCQSVTTYESGSNTFRDWFFHSRGLIFGPSTGRWDSATRTMTWTNLPEDGVILLMKLRFVDANTFTGEILIRDKEGKTVFEMSSHMKRTTENITVDETTSAGQLPPEMAALDKLVGDWEITGITKDAENPDGIKATWPSTSRGILGGRVIAAQSSGHPGAMEAYSLSTFDTFSKAYARWLFKPDGTVLEYGGGWDEKNQTMKWHWAGKDGSQSSNIWHFRGANRIDWQVLTKDAVGKTTLDFQATSIRQSEPAPANAPFNADKAKEHQEAWAKHLGIDTEITNSIGMKLRLIPPGKFAMGSPETEPKRNASREGPQHSVTIGEPFYLGIHEVTQEQYEKVMGKNPSHFSATNGGGPTHPVEMVSYNEAVEFCQKLSALPAERAAGRTYQLPSEAAWEYACRAGSITAYGAVDDPKALEPYAWHKNNAQNQTQPVGVLRANPWGLYDMHGNVFETCADQQDYKSGRSLKIIDGGLTISRGGSWLKPAQDAQGAYRGVNTTASQHHDVGFRVAIVEVKRKLVPSPANK